MIFVQWIRLEGKIPPIAIHDFVIDIENRKNNRKYLRKRTMANENAPKNAEILVFGS